MLVPRRFSSHGRVTGNDANFHPMTVLQEMMRIVPAWLDARRQQSKGEKDGYFEMVGQIWRCDGSVFGG